MKKHNAIHHTPGRPWLGGALCLLLCASMLLSVLPLTFPLRASARNQAEYEKDTYIHPGAGPMDATPTTITLQAGGSVPEDGNDTLSLDGTWKMTNFGKLSELITGAGWDKAYDATVPGSIYTALVDAGVIPDPYLSTNMIDANRYSSRNWYFLRTFTYEGAGKSVRLNFDGICNLADIYLNGEKIASHEGMFGGPYLDVTDKVKQGENVLVVHLKPAQNYGQTVVFNCSYGWHYAKLYPLGIWQSVSVEELPTVELDSPFVATYDYTKGTVDLSIDLVRKVAGDIKGTLTGVITPKNFEGKTYSFTRSVNVSGETSTTLRLRTDIPDPRLWWPNGYGAQNLYTLTLSWVAADGTKDTAAVDFGIRQLEYMPYPGGESTNVYNRTIVINGQPVYMKGAGWCTIDAMMRFSREDYDRILSRAHDAGINFFRAWGGGLVETDEFYDLCDEYGICVYQEWPCCWDSQKVQPLSVLEETVTLGAKRLRSRASLIVWGGGNEGVGAFDDAALNRIGQLTYELDGTRDFWRQDGGVGGGGITHDHIHWSGASPEHYLKTYSNFRNLNLMEYGLDGMMNMDSIAKYATAEEMAAWPIDKNGTVAYHTATFNGMNGWNPTPYGYDIDTFLHYASAFLEVTCLEDLVLGSQLAQAQADYLAAQNSRMNYPYSTTNCVYKLNDVYPGASWAIIDWYGAPKIAYYMMQDAYRPLMAAGKFTCYNTYNASGEFQPFTMPVYLLDDADTLAAGHTWQVKVTAWNSHLETVKTQTYDGKGSVSRLGEVGTFALTAEETASTPLIITVDLLLDGTLYNRSFTYMNYEAKQGSLLYLPRTHLTWAVSGDSVTITNTGKLPAVSVSFVVADSATFVCEDNYFFLDAGESVTIKVNDPAAVQGVTCFNLADPADKVAPTIPDDTALPTVTHDSATLTWSASTDDVSLFGYYVYLNDEPVDFVQATKTSYTFTGLCEVTTYHVTVEAVDDNGNLSGRGRGFTFTTAANPQAPRLMSASVGEDGTVTAVFDTALDKDSAENTAYYLLDHGAVVTAAVLGEDGKTVTLTADGLSADVIYTLGVVGVRSGGYARNRMPYTQLIMDDGLYLSCDFQPDASGRIFTGGQVAKPVMPLQSGTSNDTGANGAGWTCNGAGGAEVESIDYTFAQGCSVSLWYNGNVPSALNVLLAKGPKTDGHFEFYANAGNLKFYAPEVGDISLNVNINRGGGWHHLAIVWANNKMVVYVDGQAAGSATVSGKISPSVGDLAMGCLCDGSLSFAGSIDEVKLYNRILSAEEIAAEAKYDAPTIEVSGNDCGKSLTSDFTFADGQTVNLWFNANGFAHFNIFFAHGTKATNRHFELYTENGVLKFYAPSETNNVAVSFDVQMSAYAGGWHMLTVTHTGHQLIAYVDGKQVGTTDTSFKADAGNDTVYIGRLVEGGFEFNGSIAEPEFLDTLLTQEQMAARYKEKVSETIPGGVVSFAPSLLCLTEGGEAPLSLTAEGVAYTLTQIGDAVALEDGVLRAVKCGEAVFKAVAEDGKSMALAVVDVVSKDAADNTVDTTPVKDPELPTEPVTEPETPPDTDPVTQPDTESSVTPAPTEPSVTDLLTEPSDAGTAGETAASGGKRGCKSALGLPILGLLLLAACTVGGYKKKDR